MGKKKSKELEVKAGSDAVSSQSDVFKTLFGDVPEKGAAASSLFSDSNPFKRKPHDSVIPSGSTESFRTQKPVDYLDSDGSELKQLKRKKEMQNAQNPSLASTREALQDDNSLPTKKPKKETIETRVSKLNLESNPLPNQKEFERRKKRKRDEVERDYEARKYGVAGEDEKAKVGREAVGEKRKMADGDGAEALVPSEGFDDENKLLRTVFVGNLPLKVKKKVLLKEFSQFGKIESVRIRSIPLAETKKPRKGAIMLKQINENVDSVHAYIVFKTEESAEASLVRNMAVVAGNHIRVDRACPPRKKLRGEKNLLYDNKRTVFVGNLPFDVKDEELYQLFCSINNLESSVEAIRVVRDPQFGLSKGIAYVLFKTREAANMVVKKRTLTLRDRELRLSHARADATPSRRKNPSPAGTTESPAKRLAVVSKTPRSDDRSNKKASMSYQGLRASKAGGVQKKVHSNGAKPRKTALGTYKGEKPTERKSKRPAVAARKAKAKALKDAGIPRKQAGVKRKMDGRTPESADKKRAKRFR